MNRRRLLYIVLFIVVFSSLFLVNGIYGIFAKITEPVINKLTIEQNTSYTVVHELMDLNGSTYTEYRTLNYTNIPIGTEVTPAVLTLEGFDSPSVQAVTLNSFTNTVITYRYTRKQYTLTINDSNHVTTQTPSGTYYYGQEIHLVADNDDGSGCPFLKWSNNETNPNYTFTLTDNTTIGPIYANSYTITYVPNNGSNSFTERVIENNPIGVFPTVENNDCSSGTGTYQQLGCTYVYELLGWYKESTFNTKVDESFIPTANTTLYAKWNKVYYANSGPTVFDGSNYIDTGVKLFSQENAKKDFIVTFTVDVNNGYNPTNNSEKRGTIFTDMNEVGQPYYGVHFYYDTAYVMNANSSNNTSDRFKRNDTGYVTGQKVILKRENGIVYYSYDDGLTYHATVNFSSFTDYFDNNATFGAGIDKNGNMFRYFKGTLSDMSVELLEPESYTIHYDANGGSGVMADQNVVLGENTSLSTNSFTNTNASFAGWNTTADGSGTSYPNNYTITSDLGNANDVITLYAQWIPIQHFYVHYDANGGTGTMSNQTFVYGDLAKPLTANAFTRANYEFRGWNTAADGSGTHYNDEQAVRDLSAIDEDVVTLYAQWWKIQFIRSGDVTFDCTANTFIDTNINVFSNTNINKDFEIRFTFKSVASDQMSCTTKQPTFFNVKDESNQYMPGFNIRFNNKSNVPITEMTPTYKWKGDTSASTNINGILVSNAPIEFIYKRTNGIITIRYKYNNMEAQETMINQSTWTLNQPFATNVAFGGYFDGNNNPGRFFKGTLADLIILMDD